MGLIHSKVFDRNRVNSEYFKALSEEVLCDHGDKTYDLLVKDLYSRDFLVVLERDQNRAQDGLDLREKYMGDDADLIGGECSILEMLIALAGRIDTIMYDPTMPNQTARWFWEMVENLGLESMDDANFSVSFVADVINRLNNRKYDADGFGGLFPLLNPPPDTDQRKVEIWYQMQAYLNENY